MYFGRWPQYIISPLFVTNHLDLCLVPFICNNILIDNKYTKNKYYVIAFTSYLDFSRIQYDWSTYYYYYLNI